MKVQLPDMYKEYLEYYKEKRTKVRRLYDEAVAEFDTVCDALDGMEEYSFTTTCNLDQLDDIKSVRELQEVRPLPVATYMNDIDKWKHRPNGDIILYKVYCKSYITLKHRINKIVDINKTLPPTISYTTFAAIVREFFKELQLELLNGYVFNPGFSIGRWMIAKKPNYFKVNPDVTHPVSNRRINWGATNKIKNELIASGKPLYNDRTGVGSKYIIYIDTDFSLWLRWNKGKCLLPNKVIYSLVPAQGHKHIVKVSELPKDLTIEEIAALPTGMITKIKYIEQHRPEYHRKYVQL